MEPLITKIVKYFMANNKSKNIVLQNPDSEFVPYAIHFDKNTILTKNGELMQIIKIVGFSNASVYAELVPLREAVRDSVRENIKQINHAIWFTTIRRKKNISPEGEFREFFSKKINDTWEQKNNLKDDYVNELFITIITEGIDTSITNVKSFANSFSRFATRRLHNNALQKASENLSKVVSGILSSIQDYGGHLLELTEIDDIIYSEPMSFLGKICNLEDKMFPLKANDISDDLFFNKVAFSNREINIVGDEKRYYGGLLTLKEYVEIETESLDKILQLPLEFIITQAFDFSYSDSDLEFAKHQDYLLRVSQSEDFRQITGFANFFESVDGTVTDYGKSQISFMIIAKSSEDLSKSIHLVSEKFQALGLVSVREDVFLEDCYWAQLPGNFKFLKRQKIINSYRIGGFASLYSFDSGAISGTYWGPALTTFKTINNTPYFFNFHESDNGHALFIGGDQSGKTVLIDFIIGQARRYNNKTYYFDFNNKARNFIEMIGGFYYDLSFESDHKNCLKINPLYVNDNADYRKFLSEFFYGLISHSKDKIPQEEIQLIPEIVENILIKKITNFAEAIQTFNNDKCSNLYQELKIWGHGGEFDKIFDHQREINWSDRTMGFDFTEYHDKPHIIAAILFYLLYRVENNLDGRTPTIIVFKDADKYLNNSMFFSKISDLLDRIRIKNGLVIFSINMDKNTHIDEEFLSLIIPKVSAKFILSDNNISDKIAEIMKLNDEERRVTEYLQKNDHKFLLKFADDSLILNFDLSDQLPLLKLLSCDYTDIAILEEIFSHAKSEGKIIDNEIAINQYYDIINILEEERLAEKKRLEHEQKIARMKKLRELKTDDD